MNVRVLGIDPGSQRTGWGVVQLEGTRLRHIGAGTISNARGAPLHRRLLVIHKGLEEIIAAHAPEAVAVEEIFFAKFANAALKLGHARGVALLVAAQSSLSVHEYTPAVVKRTVVGRGQADKAQVGQMVAVLLGLSPASLEVDASDALAVAITHIQAARSGGAKIGTSVQ